MKKNWLIILCLSLVTLGWCLTPAVGSAQTPDTAPKIVMLVSLQQESLTIDDQVGGLLEISNQSDVAADDVQFAAALPGFVIMHAGSCAGAAQAAALDLGPLLPHSVKSQPFCLTLDPNAARAGSFNLLFEINYSWGQKTDLVSAEKTIQVDLIGNQTILGLPLAFAGFILPGLMFLIALRWFKAPWAVGLSGEDRLIYGVLLSLVLLGPFALLGGLANAPGWVQFLNFSQQVTIPRLGVYVLIGLVVGVGTGACYQKIKADQARKLAAEQLTLDDDFKTVIQKALLLNPDYHGGKVSFRHKQKGSIYQGAHFVETGSKLYVFSQFRLNGSQLDPSTLAAVKNIIGTTKDFNKNRALILSVLNAIPNPAKGLIQVSDPVLEIGAGNVADEGDSSLAFVELDAADYSAPTIVRDDDTVLLEILF